MLPLEPTDWETILQNLVKINAVLIITASLVGFTFKKIFGWVFKQNFN